MVPKFIVLIRLLVFGPIPQTQKGVMVCNAIHAELTLRKS